MIAIDTDVLVRLVTNDDPVQGPPAAAVFASDDVFISKTVILETEWVLRHAYELETPAIMSVLARLFGTPSVSVEDAKGLRRALDWFSQGMDFADALHLSSCADTVEHFASFDKKLASRATKLEPSCACENVEERAAHASQPGRGARSCPPDEVNAVTRKHSGQRRRM